MLPCQARLSVLLSTLFPNNIFFSSVLIYFSCYIFSIHSSFSSTSHTHILTLMCNSRAWRRKKRKKGERKKNQPVTKHLISVLYVPGSVLASRDSISSVQLLCCVLLFAAPWTTARQASLSITNSQSLLKLVSIESEIL